MSEFDVINERLNGNDERLKRGDERFAEVAEALSSITTHLKQQDAALAQMGAKLDAVVKGTEDVVSMWSGGVAAVRFFCRCAEAWTFLLKKVLFPVGTFVVIVLFLIAIISYREHGQFPSWLADALKLVLAVL